jgi:lipopolysaccharide transport system ATP-binding protein
MGTIISVDNLSKKYVIRHKAGIGSLRASLAQTVRSALTNNGGETSEVFWALKEVGFDVAQGEMIGIIGHNGAGKSTLLKILSRITEPTSGRVEIYGRIGSLLEVGTGFHPELTGRENVYLNGSILGMKRAEIDRRFDEIVAFAEIEKFLDTPVKRYSSGMYMRLAFAVAAHLESEILLIDEVLAVGDADFQQKCFGKMNEVVTQGRTVLLVSHNMLSIGRLCQRNIWIDRGRIEMIGPGEEVIAKYLLRKSPSRGEYLHPNDALEQSPKVAIKAVRIKNSAGEIAGLVDGRHPFSVEIDYEVFERMSLLWLGFTISTITGVDIFAAADGDVDHHATTPRSPGHYTSVCAVPANLFNSGTYVLSAYAARTITDSTPEIFVNLGHVLRVEVQHPGGVGAYMPKGRIGILSPKLQWDVNPN